MVVAISKVFMEDDISVICQFSSRSSLHEVKNLLKFLKCNICEYLSLVSSVDGHEILCVSYYLSSLPFRQQRRSTKGDMGTLGMAITTYFSDCVSLLFTKKHNFSEICEGFLSVLI